VRRILLTGPEVREVLETGRVIVRKAAPIADIRFTEQKDGFISWSAIFSKPLTSRKILSTHGGTYIDEEQARHYIGSGWNPLGVPGDKVWVAETSSANSYGGLWPAFDHAEVRVNYACDGATIFWMINGANKENFKSWKNRSSAAMPQWVSRLTLEIVAVRVERGDKWEWVYELKQVQP